MPELDSLMIAVFDGNETAFARLMSGTRDTLIILAVKILGDEAAAEDCVQESFIRIWEKRQTFKVDRPAWPWIARIVRNRCYRRWRRRENKAAGNSELLLDMEYLEWLPDERISVESQIIDNEERTAVKRCVGNLPNSYREIIHLSFFQDMNDSDIAGLLGIAIGTVKSRKSRAKSALKSILYEKSNSEGERNGTF
jgi:RNA polymerase sigma-70 factor, ECF subfamily